MTIFNCERCGVCCEQPGFVYLQDEDAVRIAAYLQMEVYQFTETYCLLLDRRYLVLKKYPNEKCLFLRPEGCSLYPARPKQCRDYPLKWRTEKSPGYCEGLKKRV